ncbi:MAG: serine hydrolase [Acidobacteria bacterium]|nr:serine hydrolase [Acidobacteriota bacterium]
MRSKWLMASLFAALAFGQAPVDTQVREALKGFEGKVFVFAQNLDTGATYSLGGDERVRTASTIKLAAMAAVFQAVADGQAKFTEPVTLRNDDKVSGSGVMHELSDGVTLPLADVLHLMIVLSDNTATNLIIDRFTADRVNAEMDKLGLKATRLNRKVRGDGNQLKAPSGWSEAGKLPENQKFGLGVTTPHEMVTLLEKLEKGQVVSPEASKEMLAVMKRNQDQECIRRSLQDLTVANKSGALDALRSDVGIVYTAHGRVAMAITCDDMPKIDYSPENKGAILISKLAVILANL